MDYTNKEYAAVVAFFASSPPDQIRWLENLPNDGGCMGPLSENRLHMLCSKSWRLFEVAANTWGGMDDDTEDHSHELIWLLETMTQLDNEALWTAHGLKRDWGWAMVRRFADELRKKLGIEEKPQCTFNELDDHLLERTY